MTVQFELALPDLPDPALPSVVIARIAEARMCPVLGAHVQQAIRRLVAGMPVVLVHCGADGDVRTFGAAERVPALVGLDLDAQAWVTFELSTDDATALIPAIALAA
jgi:hypothetical protein